MLLDPDAIVERVARFARARNLFLPGPLLVAVSGGQDSICMLDILDRLAPRFGIELFVAHLDHHFRGRQSVEEAGFVRQFAAERGLQSEVAAIDVPAYRSRHRLSKQVAARYARYQFLAAVAHKSGAEQVAVGHTAGDSAETMLLNLLRGAGLAGLGGLPTRRQMQRGQLGPDLDPTDWLTPELLVPHDDLPRVLRPVLCLSRDETEGYCGACGLPFRSDPSNVDTAYRRNWVRAELLPLMERRVPGATRRLSLTADLLSDDWEIVSGVSGRLWSDLAVSSPGRVEIDLQGFLAVEQPLQRYLLRRAIAESAGSLEEVGRSHLASLMSVVRDGQVGSKVDLPGRIYLEKGYNSFWIASRGAGSQVDGLPASEVRLPVPGTVALPNGTIEAEIVQVELGAAGERCSGDRYDACLDAAVAGTDLLIRRRRPGDRFVPLGMREPKKLHDFFVDQKVPRVARDLVPIVATPGAIVWVVGHRIDDRFKVTSETRDVLILRFRGMGVGNRGWPS